MKQMLISILGEDVQVALLKNRKLWHFFAEENQKHSLRGNIYLGYVERIIPGLESAFVNIGLQRSAFLHRKDIAAHTPDLPISDLLFQGQYIIVQVLKDPIGTKGARLTTAITLSSWYLVYQPYEQRNALSQSIEDESERERLQQWLDDPAVAGVIVRTAGAYQPWERLSADLEHLRERWEEIQQKMLEQAQQVRILYEEEALPLRIFRDFMKYDFEKVTVNEPLFASKMREIIAQQQAEIQVELVPSRQRFFAEYDIYDQFLAALKRCVPLRSGANLIIEQTESMVTIDVNTSRFVGKTSQRQTLLKTNLEAAEAIALHVQLREIGGIIVIDFIDMTDEADKQQVYEALCQHFESDHMPVHILPMSELGLVQMTRKRHQESVMEQFHQRCSVCLQKAPILHHRFLALQLVDKILAFSTTTVPESLRLVGRADLVEYLKKKEAAWKQCLGLEEQHWEYHVDESNDPNFAEAYLPTQL